MKSRINVCLDGTPHFESTPMFCCLKKETENDLRTFTRVYQRAIAALRFCQQIHNPCNVSDDDREIMKVAYLRASLMEFVAMEEMLPDDLKENGLPGKALKINQTENAMLILLRELRNLQLHRVSTTFSKKDRSASMFGQEISTTILIVPRLDLLEIKNLKNAKLFNTQQLNDAIDWFDQAQLNWGIDDVLQRGVQLLADLIIHQHC